MLHASISILLASDASTGFVSKPKSCKSAIISPSDLGEQGQIEVDVLELIKELIGESKYNQLFGVGGQLEGYFVYSITLNGTEVTEEGLRPIAKDISDGKRTVVETIITDD